MEHRLDDFLRQEAEGYYGHMEADMVACNISSMDSTTWHDQRPTHKPLSQAITEADDALKRAQAELDAYLDECQNNGGCDYEQLHSLTVDLKDAAEVLEIVRQAQLDREAQILEELGF